MTRCATQLIMKSAVKGAGWSATASIPEQRSRRSRGGGGSKSGGIIKKASSPEELTKVCLVCHVNVWQAKGLLNGPRIYACFHKLCSAVPVY